MSFQDYLQSTAREIDKELDSFFLEWNKEIGSISLRLLPYGNALADACRGGKRIRGALVKLGYEMSLVFNGIASPASPGRNDKILKVAVAYEIFQASILAHDDIIDRSKYRRGKPSLYMRLGGGHAGESMAICLGDIGFFLAFRLVAESGFAEKDKNKALRIFSNTMLETGLGELLDVELSLDPRVKPEDDKEGSLFDIITVYKFKTAQYTITAPLLLGAVLGGAFESSLDAIKMFGQNLGIAFQIQDDVNDIFSNKERLGKEVGGDVREGKQTLLYAFAKDHANKQQGNMLKKYYGNLRIGAEEIEVVKRVMVETGALDYAREEARRYNQEAKEASSKITKDERFRDMLDDMTEYFVKIKDQKAKIKY